MKNPSIESGTRQNENRRHLETNVKTKTILSCLLFALLIPGMSGCMTAITVGEMSHKETESFVPRTLYKSKTDGGIAVEGDCGYTRKGNFPAFLIIPEKVILAAHRRTGGDAAVTDICALSPEILKELQLRWTLPRNYEKVCDFAGQPTVVKLRDTTFVNAGKVADLPFTVAFDAATLPIQVCLMIFFKDVGKDIN